MDTGTDPQTSSLAFHEVAILDFESCWWTDPRPKDAAIRERFGLTSVRYYQLLSSLIDRPDALRHDPLLVRRLRRLRERRTAERAVRRAALDLA